VVEASVTYRTNITSVCVFEKPSSFLQPAYEKKRKKEKKRRRREKEV
jgi:hypothetical protein